MLQSSALLHDANPVLASSDLVLDQCELSKDERQVLLAKREMNLESEKFLIEVEGEWSPPSLLISKTKLAGPKISSLMNKKFKMPPPYIPSSLNSQKGGINFLRKRKRPLQPGELARMHHSEAAPCKQHRSPGAAHCLRRKSTTNQYACENSNRSLTINRHFGRLLQGQGAVSHSSPENARLQQNLDAANASKAQRVPTPQMSRVTATAVDSCNLSELEAETHLTDRSSVRVVDDGRNKTDEIMFQRSADSTFVSNDFDEGNFYGLDDEENGDEDYISTERMNVTHGNNLASNSNLPVSLQRGHQLLSTAPNAMYASNQDETVSDEALLAMFGAASTDQGAPEARQESQAEQQPKFDQT